MRPGTLLIFLLSWFTSNLFSQETAKPLTNSEIMRTVSKMDIEGKEYGNAKVIFKSNSPDGYFSDTYKVKVTIVDMEGKEVWKKTFKNVYLYVFSDGQIQVGKPNFSKIAILKNDSGSFNGKIREKEGIY